MSAINASVGCVTTGRAALTRYVAVFNERTLLPRQGALEGLGEIEEAPADDDVIVERHKETHLQHKQKSATYVTITSKCFLNDQKSSATHHTASKADTTQARADVVPHPDAPPANALSHSQFQKEERDSDQHQQDEIRDQVRSCKELTLLVRREETVSSDHITSWKQTSCIGKLPQHPPELSP